MSVIKRPIINTVEFEEALEMANLKDIERQIISYIRFIGIFNQPMLTQALRISSKPPVLSILCESCRKIGENMPYHFEKVRKWSEAVSTSNVRWDGDLICSSTFNTERFGIR